MRPPRRVVHVQRQGDGSFVDWGRHAVVGGVRGEGPARWYKGEAAAVIALLLRHAVPPGPETRKAPPGEPAGLSQQGCAAGS